MQLNQLDGLVALLAVAERHSFTRAAKVLGVSPSAVSQAVRQLESRLGVALLARTTRSTRLTEAGEKFLADCGPALRQVLTALDGAGSYADKPAGTLRLNLPRVAYPLLAPHLAEFRRRWPEILLDLCCEDQVIDIVSEGFDAGIRMLEMTANDMLGVRLSPPFRFVIAASPAYLRARGVPQTPPDLLQHACVVFRYASGATYQRWEFERDGRDSVVEVKPALLINDALLMIDAAERGLGLIYSIDTVLAAALAAGRLALVLEAWAPGSDGFFLYCPRQRMSPKLRVFIDFLREKLR